MECKAVPVHLSPMNYIMAESCITKNCRPSPLEDEKKTEIALC